MSRRFFDWISLFETNMSAAEWAWRIVTFLVLAAGGTTAGLLAKGSEIFRSAGYVAWVGIGLCTAILMAVILFLVKLSALKAAQAEYTRAMAARPGSINPLLASFTDLVIPIEDLRLPGKQAHANKHFKRCKFVGPGAIAILGGTYLQNGFYDGGDIIVLPDPVVLTGIPVFQNCTVEESEFYRVTVLTNKPVAIAFKSMGATVAGLDAA
jgi:hypothetical protein